MGQHDAGHPGIRDSRFEKPAAWYAACVEPSFTVVKQYALTRAKRLAGCRDPIADEIEQCSHRAQTRARELPGLVQQLPDDDPELARVNREWARAVDLMGLRHN